MARLLLFVQSNMGRTPLIRTDAGIYHVMTRVNNKMQFPLPLEACWRIFMEKVARLNEKFEVRVFAFVLMLNHYHMFIRTPRRNIDEAMKSLNREVTRAISSETGLINHIFGARYRWNIAYDQFAKAQILKYIFRNPVRARIVERVEHYRFSTVKSLWEPECYPSIAPAGELFPKSDPDHTEVLDWLNTPLGSEQEELLKKAMRRKEFSFSREASATKWVDGLRKNPW